MPSYLSLFCGCGGLDLGFQMAGYDCEQAYDIDHTAVESYNYNIGGSRARVADLRRDSLPSAISRPDVIVAGPPCQGFSTIGRRDPDDPRNHLLLRPIDLAIQVKVRVLLLENVCGVLSGSHSRYWKEAIWRLESSGYTTATSVVTASSVGLAQIRRRVVLVAARRSFDPLPSLQAKTTQTLASILDVPHNAPNHLPKRLDPNSRAGLIASHIRPGQKLSNVRNGASSVHTWDIPTVFGRVSDRERALLDCMLALRRRLRVRTFGDADPVPYSELRRRFGSSTHRLLASLVEKDYVRKLGPVHYDLRRTFNGKYRRLHPNAPAHSVLTKFCDPTHFLHPFEDRPFTIREAARLQGFPDTFRFLGSESQQSVQVGNAVPPPVAANLARWIRRELL